MKASISPVEAAALAEFDIVAEAEAILIDALFADIIRDLFVAIDATGIVESGDCARAQCVEWTDTAEGSGIAHHIRAFGRSPPQATTVHSRNNATGID